MIVPTYSVNVFMEETEIDPVMKFLVLEDSLATEIREGLRKVLKKYVPSFFTVSKWTKKFERGRISLEDDPRSVRSKSVTRPELVPTIHDIIGF